MALNKYTLLTARVHNSLFQLQESDILGLLGDEADSCNKRSRHNIQAFYYLFYIFLDPALFYFSERVRSNMQITIKDN